MWLTGDDDFAVVPVSVDAIEVPADYPRRDLGDLEALTASIGQIGLLQAINASPGDGSGLVLRSGLRRLEACRAAGWPQVPVLISDGLDDPVDVLVAVRDEDAARKELTWAERSELAERIEAAVKPVLRHRMEWARATGPGVTDERAPRPALSVAGEPAAGTEARDVAAHAVGTSSRSLRRARQVLAAAEDETLSAAQRERVTEQVELMESTGTVNGAWEATRAIVAEGAGLSAPTTSSTVLWDSVSALRLAVRELNAGLPGPGALEHEDLQALHQLRAALDESLAVVDARLGTAHQEATG